MVRVNTGAIAVAVLLLAVAAGGFAPSLSLAQAPTAVARVKAEVATAKAHAGFARSATTLADYQLHMGHVLNCIEGRGGRNFNARWAHVCEGMGNGILNDLREVPGSASLLPQVELAGATALGGTMCRDLAACKDTAEGLEAVLEMVEDSLP